MRGERTWDHGPGGGGGAPALAWMALPAVTHTLGKVPVGGGGPGFPSPWQPKHQNNTAGRALGAGWPPIQPSFPLACPGSWRLEERGAWGLASSAALGWGGGGWPWLREAVAESLTSPWKSPGRTETLGTPATTTGVSPAAMRLPVPSPPHPFCAPGLSALPHFSLSCSPAPGPGTSCPPIPAPAVTLGTAIPQPPRPRAAPLVPAVKT